ncbi:ParB/RepB/Spo0J family partition protein [Leptolyngbya sp. FACHB-17]|uniref:ParB/RepB/Spo0J family partition protein n=1 Tax=unclassified Leptolyngbya TaxID=2650499 RepID=UPI001680A2B6|nr:ParB/RepB/Spo0J family partition protein [Leptolyngbya sp. FACHB-17]MBD2078339.1 ParB/RepB/Spo0J family partition protein [Leptolyngbya sp. FACHB-17]
MTDLDKIIAAARAKQPLSSSPEQINSFSQGSTLLLDEIQPRSQNTRTLNPVHVEALAESISVLGLIEPLVVDKQKRLLAGGHRLAAIIHLKTHQPIAYHRHFPNEQIPIRSLAIDADQEPDLALQIEVAENEQRRDYTPTEVKEIAARLKASGYVEVQGRPKKGQKPLMPALAVVVGKNLRTIQRYLSEDTISIRSSSLKSTTRVVLLKQTLAKLKQIQSDPPTTQEGKQLLRILPEVMTLIEQCIEEG